MPAFPSDVPPLTEPFAQLERMLIDEYLRRHGQDPDGVRRRDDAEARRWLSDAATYAAARLTEVESRAHYIQDMHAGRE